MDKLDCSSVRLALAHSTELARQRKATTFLWSSEKLLACFNNETLSPITTNNLLAFIKRCTWPELPERYQDYRLAMAPVTLEPYNVGDGRESEAIRCRPVLPPCGPEISGDANVREGDYVLFFKDPSGAMDIYGDWMREMRDYRELFRPLQNLKCGPTFYRLRLDLGGIETEISDELRDESARTHPHNGNFGRCMMTGQQSTGSPGDPGSIQVQAHWIWPPSLLEWHIGPKDNCKELSSPECWEPNSEAFVAPSNLIAMRNDIYDLFHKQAFGIDVDAIPRARTYIFDSSEVSRVGSTLPRHPAVDVNDHMTRVFLRQHFQQCLFSGIFGGDVVDDVTCSQNCIEYMLQDRYGKLRPSQNPGPEEIRSWWETHAGKALNECIQYRESLNVQEEEEEEEDVKYDWEDDDED